MKKPSVEQMLSWANRKFDGDNGEPESSKAEKWWQSLPGNLIFFVASLNIFQLLIGLDLGFATNFIEQLEKEYGEGMATFTPFIVAMTPAGQMVGACLSAVTSSIFGRRGTILCCALFSILGWVGLTILGQISDPNRLSAARISAAVLCCRLSVGLSMGLSGATHPMYVFELCGAGHRWKGALNATGPVCITVGVLVSYIAGAYAGWKSAAIGVAVVPFIGFSLLVCVVPESPVWFTSRGRFEDAKDVLETLGRSDLDWIYESEMEARRSSEDTTSVDLCHSSKSARILSKPSVLKPMLILNMLFLLCHFSGLMAVIFYGVQIFQRASPSLDSYASTLLIGLTQFLGGIVGTILMGSQGILGSRRFLVSSTASVCSICMAFLAVVTYFAQKCKDEHNATAMGGISLALLIMFTFSFMAGLGPIPWILIGELLSDEAHTLTAGLSGAFSYLCIFLSSLTFPWLSDDGALGISGTFLLYSVSAAAAAAFSLIFLPKQQLENQDLVIRGRNPEQFTDLSGEDGKISAFKMSYSDSGGDLVVDREEGPTAGADATDVVFVAANGGGNAVAAADNGIMEYIKLPGRNGVKDGETN